MHLKGPFFLTQMLLPLLGPQASIVNVTSATTRVATAGVAPYAAFKGGLQVLTRYMAKEFGAQGIRVISVSPGPIRTELGGGLDAAFETALAAGAKVIHPPGAQLHYDPRYYAAQVRDLDGYSLEFVHKPWQHAG